jgi:vacuolar protein sorting-associated protein VTA1
MGGGELLSPRSFLSGSSSTASPLCLSSLFGSTHQHEEKVRYAKWRAADISKALREGRQPTTPVPTAAAAGEPTGITMEDLLSAPGLSDTPNTPVSHEMVEEPYSASAALPPVSTAFGEGEGITPFEIQPRSAPLPINGTGTRQAALPTGSPSPSTSIGSPTSKSRRHQADSRAPPPPEATAPPPSSQSSSPPRGFSTPSPRQERGRRASLGTTSLTSSPTTGAQRSPSPTHFVPRNSPPSTVPYLTGSPYASAPPLPPPPQLPSAPYLGAPHPPPLPPPPARPEPSQPPELTPGLITKAQKHCRFAISALDYEDAEQARKELRSALAILGG